MPKFLKWLSYAAFALFVLLLFLPFFYPRYKGFLNAMIKPLIPELSQKLYAKDKTSNELEKLQKEVQELKIRNSLLSQVYQENQELRLAHKVPTRPSYDIVHSPGALRSPVTWRQRFLLNKGKESKILEGSAVCYGNILLGRVASYDQRLFSQVPYKGQAQVESIMLNHVEISCRIRGLNCLAVLSGAVQKPSSKAYCRLSKIPRDLEVKKGMIVESSGLGAMIPSGLLIGKIVETQKDEKFQEATVELFHDFRDLNFVSIIVPHKDKILGVE